ncbi:SMP-30/gluconolactonase/LRE family protein [Microbacterium sp. 4R-513]|uniref:SMP-30/gluconolactonase/LRE family protein n=1 Tax=Microbacterium sp. 4R-513 TaxID=2567934 RepID=UPI0013E152D5|nr:SMP-30/gluconolactonase/LRE family protein [Microbacterium sp. 4R-513]QIG39428.1 SMP-30/gluconolactonase/LRE family protein [Microbacterium sp. 4R-513]
MVETPTVAVQRRAECGEGPVWDAAAGVLHWVDIIPGEILRTDLDTGRTTVTSYPEMVGAVAQRAHGGIVAAVASGFAGLDQNGVVDRRVDCLAGGTRMNDAKVAPDGRFWAGSCAMDFAEGAGGLWMLDQDWVATLVVDGLTQPNGLDWSCGRDAFYLVETQARQVLRFAWDVERGTIDGAPTVLIDADAFTGYPDGLCVDTRGHLWIAEFAGAAVHEFTPNGERLRTIAIPTPQPTSCAFVGPDLDELWVTSAAFQLDLADDADAGSIFRLRDLGATGLPLDPIRWLT